MRRPNAAGTILQALEPMAKKLTELEARTLEGVAMPVAALMGELVMAARAAARRGTELLLQQAAAVVPAEPSCPACSSRNVGSHGFEPTSFIGRVGRVELSRRRLECGTCKHSWFDFDERWRLPAGDYADDVREATERLSCRLGFREAVDELEHLWGVAPDASTAQRWTIQDGQRAEQAVAADAKQHWERYEQRAHAVAAGEQRDEARTQGFGVIEVDGVHVLTWKPGQEPRKGAASNTKAVGAAVVEPAAEGHEPRKVAANDTEAVGAAVVEPAAEGHEPRKVAANDTSVPAPTATSVGSESSGRVDHQAPSTLSQVAGSPMGPTGRSPRVRGREVCMGLTYLGEDACEESPGRGVLLERRYVATLNHREDFWKQLHAAAQAQGVLARQAVVRLSDGGAYFVDRSAELFRDQPLVGILDIQHGKQHVWEAGHKVVADKKDLRDWVLPRIDAIRDGRVGSVILDLAEERERRTVQQQREAIESLRGYLDRHQQLMDYPRYRKAGYPVASAAVESANKRLVGRRFKQGGMIWSEGGVEAMVALRVAFYNPGAWGRLWPHAAPTAAAA